MIVRWLIGGFLAAVVCAVPASALAVKRSEALGAILSQVGCQFGNDAATDTDTQCSNDAGMFVCEVLRKQNRVDGCGIAPSDSKIPDLDALHDADFLADAKMDQLAAHEPCVVWVYADAYVAPNRARWQKSCAAKILDGLKCRDGRCSRQALPVCTAFQRAGFIDACKPQ